MTYKIEKNIKITNRTGHNKLQEYPFAEMEVGDSFFIPSQKDQATTLRISVMSASRYFIIKNSNGWKFSSTVLENGVRIWRIK